MSKSIRWDLTVLYGLTAAVLGLMLGFFSGDSAPAYAVRTAFVLILIGLVLESSSFSEEKNAAGRAGGRGAAFFFSAYTVLVFGMGLAGIGRLTGWAFFGAGCLLTLTGMLFRLLARRALGTLFSYSVRIQNDHRLVTRGIYRYCRHPAYGGTWLYLAGLPLVLGIWPPFLLLLPALPFHCRKVRKEEEMLEEEFGEEYIRYRERTLL